MSPPGSTSRDAYTKHVVKGKATTQRDRILRLLDEMAPLSRHEICRHFTATTFKNTWDDGPEIPLASVCGRVNALIESAQVRVAMTDIDKRTGQRVELVELVENAPVQKTFEGAFR